MSQNATTSTNVYVVKTPAFEGPLDLLLDLIEKRKFSINEISLAKVADDYIGHVKTLYEFPIAMTAHFILIASTLLLIKSRALLPTLELSEEEQGSIEDLERRLNFYKRARELGRHLRSLFGAKIMFAPEQRLETVVFSPDPHISAETIAGALKELMQHLPKESMLRKAIVEKVISLEKMLDDLTSRIKTSLKLSFREFAGTGKKEKVHVIVSFLAMLELVKQGIISVEQERHLGEIYMETERIEVPRYT
jgi:segregation and condensation protein A